MPPNADPLLARTEVIVFGPFRLDLRAGRLLHGRDSIPLRPKTWSVLRYLAERPGVLVTKQELLDAVWADAVVTESVLSKSIGELRVALGDSFRTPRLVETVQRRGFRFIAPLSDSSAPRGTGLSVEPTGGPSPDLGVPDDVPFVGRAEELRRLADLLAQAHAGRRQIVFVSGSAGIGKTALVEALLASPEIHAARPVSVARGSCVELHGQREPYMPVLEALGRLARRPDSSRLHGLLRQVAPTWLAQTPWLVAKDEAQALSAPCNSPDPNACCGSLPSSWKDSRRTCRSCSFSRISTGATRRRSTSSRFSESVTKPRDCWSSVHTGLPMRWSMNILCFVR